MTKMYAPFEFDKRLILSLLPYFKEVPERLKAGYVDQVAPDPVTEYKEVAERAALISNIMPVVYRKPERKLV